MKNYQYWITGLILGLTSGLIHAAVMVSLQGQDALTGMGGLSLHLVLSGLMGMTFSILFGESSSRTPESLMNGLTFGLFWWVLVSLNLVPILMGKGFQWQVALVANTFPHLMGFLLQGSLIGLFYPLLFQWITLTILPLHEGVESPPTIKHRIVILGGGFAGVTLGQHLERKFYKDTDVSITLISKDNSLLFTPLLSEVTSSGIEARHISASLRSFFNRVRVIRAEATHVDYEKRIVHITSDIHLPLPEVPYDHLVLTVGAETNFYGMKDVEEEAFTFRTLEDALVLRNHLIDMLERADAEPDPVRRRALLTIVVIGGGFSGTELIGGLNDFVRGSLWFYRNIPPEELRMILVHSGERILPELGDELGDYAHEKMEARGVAFKLKTRAKGARPGVIVLNTGEEIQTETLVWTTGTNPSPFIQSLGLEGDKRGWVQVDPMLAVSGHPGVWAIGDCASIQDEKTGRPHPQTAQLALREAMTLAHNIKVTIRGGMPKKFRYRSLGSFTVLGHQTAAAQIGRFKFSGFFAWWLWRTVYLLKLPSLEKKIRVAMDWTVDLFFPRDIVQTRTGVEKKIRESGSGKGSKDKVYVHR
jgi:NADH dehydrogenase